MEVLKEIIESIRAILKGDADAFSYVIIIIGVAIVFVPLTFRLFKAKKEEKSRKDLHPYFDDEQISLAKRYYIETQCQDRPPEVDSELNESADTANKMNLILFFKKKVFNNTRQRFYLILGDAGMGKTTFMINLYLKYNSGLFPKDYKIAYIPLSYSDSDIRISELKPNEKGTILLLDGFDEDPKALEDWEKRIREIISKVQNFRKVIITCRTQFFPNEEKIPYQLELLGLGLPNGVHTLDKKHVSPFTDGEIKRYLKKKYGRSMILSDEWFYYNQRRVKADKIVEMAPTLAVRPMLLDKIDELVQSNRDLQLDYQVFEELVFLWIDREAKKQLSSINSDFKKNMYDFLIYAAIRIYTNFREGQGFFISIEQIEEIAQDKNIQLGIMDMTSRSLLNRNPDGRIKFSHKTILEYFLAIIDAEEIDSIQINFNSFTYAVKLRIQILNSRLSQIYRAILISSTGGSFRQMKMNEESVNYLEAIMLESTPTKNSNYFRLFPSLKSIYILNEIGRASTEKRVIISSKKIKEKTYPFFEREITVVNVNGENFHAQISSLDIQVLKANCYQINLGEPWNPNL